VLLAVQISSAGHSDTHEVDYCTIGGITSGGTLNHGRGKVIACFHRVGNASDFKEEEDF
jgi:hypothetical protein